MPPMASTVINNTPRQPEPQTSRLLLLPNEILHQIFLHSGIPTFDLWKYRTVCKRLAQDDYIHKHLVAHLREVTTPFPRTLILDPAPVPVGFLYNITLTLLGYDEGRAFWHRLLQQAGPGDAPSPLIPAAVDHDAATSCLLDRLRRDHAEIREAHLWSFLAWYKEREVLSLRVSPRDLLNPSRRRRQHRLDHAFRQDDARVSGLRRSPHLAKAVDLDLNGDKQSLRPFSFLTRYSFNREERLTTWYSGWVYGTSNGHFAWN